jgi:polyhydroxybutyrate depolymerase
LEDLNQHCGNFENILHLPRFIFQLNMKNILLTIFSICTLASHAQVTGSLMHDGLNRTYTYFVPSTWTANQSLPLLILLHGLTQTGNGVMGITDFNQLAEDNQFIVVYPDGINFAWNANMNVSVSNADDMGFIESLASSFQQAYNTNPLKQYLVGFSNGGFMSHKMACESSMCFAAIATVAGNMSDTVYANCNPVYNPAVLHIHGTADAVVPYNGGTATGVSVDQTMQKWAGFLNCSGTPTTVNMPNNNAFDLSSPQRITYLNGTNSLELIKITGGGHQWPGISTLVGGAGTINMDFYSPDIIWEFLNGKSCPTAGVMENSTEVVTIWPNPSSDLIHLECATQIHWNIRFADGRYCQSGKGNAVLHVSEWADGIYFIEFDTNAGKTYQSILKYSGQ